LAPSSVFLDAYRMERLPEDLDCFVGVPEEFFLAPDTLAPYVGKDLIPILDDGNFGTVLFLDSASGALVEQFVEAPGETVASYKSWQEYLAALFIRIAGSVDDDDQLRKIALLIGYSHGDRALTFLAGLSQVPGEDQKARIRDFVAGHGST
jgi:hypothetical protein